MTHKARLILSWPAPALWQNRRFHWGARASVVKTARAEGWCAAMSQGLKRRADPEARLVFAFHPPPRSRPDMQNMPATMKAQIDGIADAMGVDDRRFRCVWPETFSDRLPGGAVLVTVETKE